MNRSRVWLSGRMWVTGLCAMGLTVALASTATHAQDPAPASQAAGTGAKGGKVDAEALYKEKCQVCHLAEGNSPLPNMNFADGKWVHGSSLKEVVATITNGVPGTAMISWKAQGLTDAEIQALAKYVRHFDKNLDKGGAKKKTS